MRIAVVHSYYSSRQPSGENTVVGQQADLLRQAGHDVHVVGRHTDALESTPYYRARSALVVASGRGRSPIAELSAIDPDVIHLHNTFPNLGTSWLKDWGRRTVVTLHNYRTVCAAGTLFREGSPCRECLHTPILPAIKHACYRDSRAATTPLAVAAGPHGALRRVGRDVGAVVALNTDAQAVLSVALGRPVEVVPNFSPPQRAARDDTRTGWIFVGRLSSEKGAQELVEAWPEGEPLDIYGDGPLRRSMEALATKRSLSITFRGLTPHQELMDLLPSYEGLVVPSMCAEGLPTIVIEALARGVPAVVSDLVSLAPALCEAGAGVALRVPASEHSVRQAIKQLRALPATSRAARELHRTAYSPEAWLSKITPIYEGVARCAT